MKIQHCAFKIDYSGIAKELCSEVIVLNFLDDTKHHKFNAIWDTGATNSVITKNVVNKLNLIPTGMTEVHGVNSKSIRNTYLVNFFLPNRIGIKEVNVTESEIHGVDVLIGMDIICIGDFSIANYKGQTTFCYSFPPHHNKIDLCERAEKINKKKS
jgi:hypothetical protein